MSADQSTKTHDVVMIGAGPANLAAAIYTTREDIDTVLIEKGVIGGLAAITDSVENYPGFPDGVGGLELAQNLRTQAEKFGATIELAEVSAIKDEGTYKRLTTTDGDYLAKAVLIGTGTSYVMLGVPGEQEFYGRGVHYCATCDGALYRDKHLVVIGSGNSSAQESLFLTRFASHIDILIRGDKWKASDVLVERIAREPKITVHFNTTTERIEGEGMKVTKVIGHDKAAGKSVEFPADGVFVFVGLFPNTKFLDGSGVELDERQFVVTDDKLETKIPGVFAAGDVRSCATMQIASAVGEGATAALKIREFLED
jgi:thioredoxin reductase (NADPH)